MLKNELRNNISNFVLGGKADFFIVQEPEFKHRFIVKRGKYKGVYLVSGSYNNGKIAYLGTLRQLDNGGFSFNVAKDIGEVGSYLLKGLVWVLEREHSLPSSVHVLHNGRCGMCGRVLTDSESVARGFGSHCFKMLGF